MPPEGGDLFIDGEVGVDGDVGFHDGNDDDDLVSQVAYDPQPSEYEYEDDGLAYNDLHT